MGFLSGRQKKGCISNACLHTGLLGTAKREIFKTVLFHRSQASSLFTIQFTRPRGLGPGPWPAGHPHPTHSSPLLLHLAGAPLTRNDL